MVNSPETKLQMHCWCHNLLLLFPSTTPTLPAELPVLIMFIRLTCFSQLQSITQALFNKLFHTHSCQTVVAPCTSLLHSVPYGSPGTRPAFRLLSVNFASAPSLSAWRLSGHPLQRLLPQSAHRMCSPARVPDCHLFGFMNIVNKALNCSGLDLCCSWVHCHTCYSGLCWYSCESALFISL